MPVHKFNVGDVLQMCTDTLDKVKVVYLSQSTNNKIRALVLGSDDENKKGKVYWYDDYQVKEAEKVGYDKYTPYVDYKEGDKIIIIGACCETEHWNSKPLTFQKFQHPSGHSYNHKVILRDGKNGAVTACVHCIRHAQPQIELL